MNLAHLPTLMLAVGYPVYWSLMLSGQARSGITPPVCWLLFVFFTVFICLRDRHTIVSWTIGLSRFLAAQRLFSRVMIAAAMIIGLFILSCAFLASLQPPYLQQESDVMNYHLSLPRQHLILGSFERIPWSADDLFFLPVDFALAPFWFVAPMPNKVPQFLFLLGVMGTAASLVQFLKKDSWMAVVLCLFALLGSHGHGVQMGTGMLDMVVCYLFLAAIDSLLRRQKWLFITEITFFIWAKSLIAAQLTLLGTLVLVAYGIQRLAGVDRQLLDFQKVLDPGHVREIRDFLADCLPGLMASSLCVAGPFLFKSLYYAGTPVFPVAFGLFSYHPGTAQGSVAWESLGRSAQYLTGSIHHDGYGRSFVDFLMHFWILAVPETGVNNAFDYPMGLPYLMFLGPFLYFLVRSAKRREFPVLPWLIVCYWALWWFSVRETRHLYAPVLLMFIVCLTAMSRWSKVFFFGLLIAMALNALNIYRANQGAFFKSPEQFLRAGDLRLYELSAQYRSQGRSDTVELDDHEVAYALFPVVVRKEFLPHVVAFESK